MNALKYVPSFMTQYVALMVILIAIDVNYRDKPVAVRVDNSEWRIQETA